MGKSEKAVGVGLSGNKRSMWLDSYFHPEVILELSQAKGFRGPKHDWTFEPLGFIGAVGHEC